MSDEKEVTSTYDFDADAMGFGEFIQQHFATAEDDELVVWVYDDQGRAAKSARFVRERLSDDSHTVNLVIEFGREHG